jgi:hypothetical protein
VNDYNKKVLIAFFTFYTPQIVAGTESAEKGIIKENNLISLM